MLVDGTASPAVRLPWSLERLYRVVCSVDGHDAAHAHLLLRLLEVNRAFFQDEAPDFVDIVIGRTFPFELAPRVSQLCELRTDAGVELLEHFGSEVLSDVVLLLQLFERLVESLADRSRPVYSKFHVKN